MNDLLRIPVSFVPVLLFVVLLLYMDSYKLVRLKQVALTIAIGGIVAAVCLQINSRLTELLQLDVRFYARLMAPIIEESAKAAYVFFLIRARRVGFLVDSAIYGFAVGAGFALVENIYYMWVIESSDLLLWIVRGFGTAIMHGSTSAIVGILGKNYAERRESEGLSVMLPGLALAIAVHSLFNQFILPPAVMTATLLIVLSILVTEVFRRSERATRHWLGVGLDRDMKIWEAITSGRILETKIGKYLETLNDRFSVGILTDMLGLVRINVLLSARAKGVLLMRQNGIDEPPDPEIHEMFEEMEFLRKSIGRTGMLALKPFLQTSSRALWQMYFVSR